jgi:type I restriction enzyme S subunit
VSSFGELTAPKIEQTGPTGDAEFVYVDISSIDNQAKRIVDPKRLTPEAAPSRARQRLRKGDVLVSMTRPNLNAVAIVPPDLDGAIGSTGFHVLRANDDVEPHWLYYAVQSNSFVKAMCDLVQGALYPAVRPKDIREYAISPPPLATQREIVAELEKQFSRLDEAVANLQRVKANLKRYKASVLKAAVEGRLVETEAFLARREGRTYESGEQLLQRILEERRVKWVGRGKYRAPTSADLAKVSELPTGWSWSSLDQLTSKITSGSRDWSQYYGRGTGTFVLAQNVRPLHPDFSVRQFVDPPSNDPSCGRSRVQDDDLLATIVGANAGQICLVSKAPNDAYVCQSVALIRPVERSTSVYLNYWLNSAENGQRYLDQCMYGQGRPHLSFEQLMATPIALPPLEEQIRIVAEVDRHLSIIREVETEVDATLRRAHALRQSTLANAFSSGVANG